MSPQWAEIKVARQSGGRWSNAWIGDTVWSPRLIVWRPGRYEWWGVHVTMSHVLQQFSTH